MNFTAVKLYNVINRAQGVFCLESTLGPNSPGSAKENHSVFLDQRNTTWRCCLMLYSVTSCLMI